MTQNLIDKLMDADLAINSDKYWNYRKLFTLEEIINAFKEKYGK